MIQSVEKESKRPTVSLAIAITIVSFPLLLILFASFGLASAHGDGMLLTLGCSVALGITGVLVTRRSVRMNRALSWVVVSVAIFLLAQMAFAFLSVRR